MLKQAIKFAKKEKVKIRVSLEDARNIGRRNETYDLILLMGDSIGSIPKSENSKNLNECYRILKKNGTLIITLGNRYAPAWWAPKIIFFYLWRQFLSIFRGEKVKLGIGYTNFMVKEEHIITTAKKKQ